MTTKTSETPIYDQLALERALEDQEGRDLVTAIHVRQGYLPAPPREPSAGRLAILMMLGWLR